MFNDGTDGILIFEAWYQKYFVYVMLVTMYTIYHIIIFYCYIIYMYILHYLLYRQCIVPTKFND